MGDRIAILREGGHLAQYATPAELLMAPADDFVEDFVGADRALKRLALMRVSDIDLWEAPLAYVGQATGEVRAKLEGAEVPHALLVDSERRPLGWLSDARPRRRDGPGAARHLARPDPRPRRRDARRALRPAPGRDPVRAGGRRPTARIAGVLSVEIISEFLASAEAPARSTRPPSGRWRDRLMLAALARAPARPGRRLRPRAAGATELRRQERHLLPRLGDRQHRPLRRRRRSSTSSWSSSRSRSGFVIAFGLALLSHRRRWLVPIVHRRHRGPLHDPEHRLLPAAAADHRARHDDGDHRADRLQPADHLPQHRRRPRQRAPDASKDAGRGMGMTERQLLWRVELPLAVPEIIAGLRIATVSTVAIATLAVFAGAGGLGAEIYTGRPHLQDRDRRSAAAIADRDGDRPSTCCSARRQRLLARRGGRSRGRV